jgi:hypothetical protein
MINRRFSSNEAGTGRIDTRLLCGPMQPLARKYALKPVQNASVRFAARMHVVRSVMLAAAATNS